MSHSLCIRSESQFLDCVPCSLLVMSLFLLGRRAAALQEKGYTKNYKKEANEICWREKDGTICQTGERESQTTHSRSRRQQHRLVVNSVIIPQHKASGTVSVAVVTSSTAHAELGQLTSAGIGVFFHLSEVILACHWILLCLLSSIFFMSYV